MENHDGTSYELSCEDVRASPIGLDLDQSGKVERMQGLFEFDIDGDGKKQVLKEWFENGEVCTGQLFRRKPYIISNHSHGN